jgi:large subunit ribosomal protein L22
MSPRKVRLVIDVIRGLGVNEARAQLHVMKKAAAEPVSKLLESAIANATHNFHLNGDEMYVKSITADGGPVLGRWRARAFGRAAPIRKRTTHIAITLEPVKAQSRKSPSTN